MATTVQHSPSSSSLVSVKSGVYPTLVGSWNGNEGPALSPPGTRRSGNGIPDLNGGGALVELVGPLAGNLNGLWGIATGFAPGFPPGGGRRGTASKVLSFRSPNGGPRLFTRVRFTPFSGTTFLLSSSAS